MGLMRAKKGSGIGSGWHKADIIDIRDASDEIGFADIALKFILDINGQERHYLLHGNIVKDAHGKLAIDDDNTRRLLNKWERTMDLLDIKPFVGFNEEGEFETESGEKVTDITAYLKKHLSDDPVYRVYIGYKYGKKTNKWYEEVGVVTHVMKDTEAMNYINFLLSKGILKEDRPYRDTAEDAESDTSSDPFK